MARVPRPGEAATSVGDTPPKGNSSPRRVSSAGDTGEGRARPSRASSTPPVSPRSTKKDAELQGDLAGMYRMCAMVGMMFNRELAQSVMDHADDAADAWVQLAQRNPKVKKALVDMTTASVWGGVVSVHIAMFAPAVTGVFTGTQSPVTPTHEQDAETYRAYSSPPPPDPTGAEVMMSDDTVEAQLAFLQATDPGAYAMAMKAMGRDIGRGGPGDTVATRGNGTPVASNGMNVKSKAAIQVPDLSKPNI